MSEKPGPSKNPLAAVADSQATIQQSQKSQPPTQQPIMPVEYPDLDEHDPLRELDPNHPDNVPKTNPPGHFGNTLLEADQSELPVRVSTPNVGGTRDLDLYIKPPPISQDGLDLRFCLKEAEVTPGNASETDEALNWFYFAGYEDFKHKVTSANGKIVDKHMANFFRMSRRLLKLHGLTVKDYNAMVQKYEEKKKDYINLQSQVNVLESQELDAPQVVEKLVVDEAAVAAWKSSSETWQQSSESFERYARDWKKKYKDLSAWVDAEQARLTARLEATQDQLNAANQQVETLKRGRTPHFEQLPVPARRRRHSLSPSDDERLVARPNLPRGVLPMPPSIRLDPALDQNNGLREARAGSHHGSRTGSKGKGIVRL